jgi:hypothetical protein
MLCELVSFFIKADPRFSKPQGTLEPATFLPNFKVLKGVRNITFPSYLDRRKTLLQTSNFTIKEKA